MDRNKTFRYMAIYLPTNSKFVRIYDGSHGEHLTKAEFYDLLVRWNNQQPTRWLYVPMGETEKCV